MEYLPFHFSDGEDLSPEDVTSVSRILQMGQHAGLWEIQADPYSSSRLMDTFEKELSLDKQHLSPDDSSSDGSNSPSLYRSGVKGKVSRLSDAERVPEERETLLVGNPGCPLTLALRDCDRITGGKWTASNPAGRGAGPEL